MVIYLKIWYLSTRGGQDCAGWESTAQEARFHLQHKYESTRILQTSTHPRGESMATESHVNLTVMSSDMGWDRSCTQALQINALGCPERFLLHSNYS